MSIACLLALALGACTVHGAHEGSSAGTLTIALRKEPTSLNPLALEGTDSYTFGPLIYSYLTQYTPDGRSVGDLAAAAPTPENGGVTDGGRRLVFHLRRNVRWQDGAAVTARDVLFTYRAIMNPANNVDTTYGYDRVVTIAAPDAYTVVITLKKAFSPIVGDFFGGDTNYPILPAHLLASFSNLNSVPFNAAPVGSGPYALQAWERGDRLRLRANARYYAGTPATPELDLPFVPDDSTRIQELQTGEVDAAFLLDASRIAQLRAISGHRVVVTPVPYFYALAYNVRRPIFADAAVRKAISLSIDSRTLTRKVSSGVYDADTAMRGLFTWAYDPAVKQLEFNPAAAGALLDRDGWKRGSDGIRVKNGRRLEMQLIFPSGQEITTRLATAIAAAVRATGIDMSMRAYQRQQFIARDGPELTGNFDVSLYDYQGTFDPDASWLLACDQSAPHGFNLSGYCDATMDKLLEEAAASFDRNVRIADYRAIQRRLMEALPYFLICQISEVDVIPGDLRGFAPPLLSPFSSVASWRRSGGSSR
ncbi:MAG: peptide ABC transporter substrate-binding protein [Candidatus Eremiobacteraeota bacterium]|nr:peptide ABC transporter substrate-binding protein [Candidatus Eremiobacteraeota bacterium]